MSSDEKLIQSIITLVFGAIVMLITLYKFHKTFGFAYNMPSETVIGSFLTCLLLLMYIAIAFATMLPFYEIATWLHPPLCCKPRLWDIIRRPLRAS
jgi:hypothetical protein